MQNWLLSRLFEAKDQPKPTFAFQGTINWIRALSEIVGSDEFNDQVLAEKYSKVQRRKVNYDADTLVFENMLMAFHNLASLKSLDSDILHKYDVCRSAIIAWYYSTYFASSAMIAASSASVQETHASTARVWHSDFLEKDLLVYPFNLGLSSLVKSTVDSQVKEFRKNNVFDLNNYPINIEESHGALVSYVSGTADYRKWEEENKVRTSSAFKKLGVENFRTKKARELRDAQLEKGFVNYLVQAFRYRGKANYPPVSA